jgi:hypothetical protein
MKQAKDEKAALDRTHKVLSRLLALSDLTREHRDALNKRGLSDVEIKALGYKTFPMRRREFARRLAAEFKEDLSGVAGFWRSPATGEWDLAGKSGIAIPVRTREEKISALKLRVDKPARASAKYILLSSNPKPDKQTGEVKYPDGTSAKIAIHFPLNKPRGKSLKRLRITEGELKADVATSLTPDYTISLPGVAMWRMALDVVRELKPKKVLLAFDSDKAREQPTGGGGGYGYPKAKAETAESGGTEPFIVAKSLAGLYLSLKEAGFDVAIEDWPEDAGKGIDDVLLNGAQDQIRLLEGEAADEYAKDQLSSGLPVGWIYIVGTKTFVHAETMLEIDKEQFADRYCHETKGNPAQNALRNPAFPKCDLPIYLPRADQIFEREGHRYFNLWRANVLEPRKGSVKPFLDHCAYMLPDETERNTMLDWLAWNVQHAGEKIMWALLLQGTQGTGKSYFGWLMRLLLGKRNVSMPTNDLIHEIYTTWQKSCQLVIVEELMARGRMELVNKLKPIITQDTTIVREMHRPAYEQPNVFNLLLFTNHEDAIIIDSSDRRYCVLFSPAEPREPEYYAKLWEWTEVNAGVILRWMNERNLSKFQAKAHAPMTAGKRQLILSSMSNLQAWMVDAIETNSWPFMSDLVSTTHLMDCLPNHLRNVSIQAVGRALKQIGARMIGQYPLANGSTVRILAVRRFDTWAGASKEVVVSEYEKWSMSAQPGGNPLAESKPM